MQATMTRSICQICDKSFPHGAIYSPATCGRCLCLKAAVRDAAEIELVRTIREDSRIAEASREIQRHINSGAEPCGGDD